MAVWVRSWVAMVVFFAAHAAVVSAQNGLLADYYSSGGGPTPQPPPGSPAGTTSTATPLLTRIDATIDFGWGTGTPDPLVPVDGFMVSWRGRLTITTAGDYQFRLRIDDGGRMWIDNVLVPLMNGTATASWIDQGPTDWTGTVVGLTAGVHTIRVEFYENGGGAEARMSYSGADNGNVMGIVPTGVLQPPPPPATPTVTAVQAAGFVNAADVSWTDSGAGVTYDLQRSVAGGAFTTIQTGLTGLSYQDTNLAYGTLYCYQVRAVEGTLMSPYSTPGCVTLNAPPPRTNNHTEGFIDDNCACGSTISTPWAAGAALAFFGLAWLRRRPR